MEPLNILIIDSITDALKLGLSINGKRVEYNLNEGFKHVENLIPAIDCAFEELGESPEALKMIAVCCGPGSFTGIRIGIATAMGLSYAGRIDCFGFSFFDIYRYLFRGEKGAIVAPIIDARKSRFYTSFIESDNEAELEMLDLTQEELLTALKKRAEESGREVILTGRDCHLLKDAAQQKGLPLREAALVEHSACDLLDFAHAYIEKGSLKEPNPIYLRKSEAEIALLKSKGL